MLEEPTPASNIENGDLPPESVLFGRSATMQRLKQNVLRVCSCSVPVLLQGEIGTGKDMLARFIHHRMPRGGGTFERLHCAGLEDAMDVSPFWFVETDSPESSADAPIATVYLDQVNELTPQLQRQLLRSLVDREERRPPAGGVGCSRTRVISSSTCSIRKLVKTGGFRRDLFDLLAVVTLDVPPLRHRTEDIPILAEYLRACCTRQLELPDKPFSGNILKVLTSLPWPGNIRELQSYVYQCVLLGEDHYGIGADRTAEDKVTKPRSGNMPGSATARTN